ncbi:endonuclease V [Micromonospora sp. DT229]|uniref:endonuclease V n=1 Tax=Micromonospora sp. DT229 TaxID=3393430 RepID=UPI003CEEA4F5
MAPVSVAEAERIQEQLRQRLDLHEHLTTAPRLVAGVDVSYDKSSPRVAAAAVVFDLATGVEVESAVVPGEVSFPYVPELPTFGVAKTPFVAGYDEPGEDRGDWSPLRADGQVLGRVLRTQIGVKPVFVSVGHRTTLDQATTLTLDLSPRYRLPEVIRRADFRSREALRRVRRGR